MRYGVFRSILSILKTMRVNGSSLVPFGSLLLNRWSHGQNCRLKVFGPNFFTVLPEKESQGTREKSIKYINFTDGMDT